MKSKQNICWFDITVKNLETAMEFYTNVLATKLQNFSTENFKMAVFDHQNGVVGGCLVERSNFEPCTSGFLIYFDVNGRLKEAESLVEKFGGKVLEPVHAVGPHGFRSVVLDSEGNRIALHSETLA